MSVAWEEHDQPATLIAGIWRKPEWELYGRCSEGDWSHVAKAGLRWHAETELYWAFKDHLAEAHPEQVKKDHRQPAG